MDTDMNQKKLIMEMGAIVLIAAAFGLIWNRGMLYDVWSGKQGGMSFPPSTSADQGDIPLPAGLLQVKEMFDRKEAVFVDARDVLVFAQGHIKGAVSLPVGIFDGRISEFKAKVPLAAMVVVYCSGYGCHDSMIIGKKLMAAGYRQVFVYEGGYPEWKDGGLPVESQKQ
jgi:rhodanese-related sulfurtransferase